MRTDARLSLGKVWREAQGADNILPEAHRHPVASPLPLDRTFKAVLKTGALDRPEPTHHWTVSFAFPSRFNGSFPVPTLFSPDPIYLGIDAGGTYTDTVLWNASKGVMAKAKALTTHYDLAVAISSAVDTVLMEARVSSTQIKLVSVSTTLATNALVEQKHSRAALVLIGFDRRILNDKDLAAAIGTDPVIFCVGGHDALGEETPLDLAPLEQMLPNLKDSVLGVAICGHFAVRNPTHELAAQRMVAERTALPVTTSHELSAKLGGPRRAVTTLLNARLVPNINQLLNACEALLQSRAITAPLMVVRGDGSLVSSGFARTRPIETILSGPAAGVVGAQYLCQLQDAVVSDIGGTTTDVTILDKGKPRLDPAGANVGGFRTMVEAVATSTFGVGGDSEVAFIDGEGVPRLTIGPRRCIPLSLAAYHHESEILDVLKEQSRKEVIDEYDGRFVVRTGLPESAAALSASETNLLAAIGPTPVPLSAVVSRAMFKPALTRLISRDLVQICSITPSDAAHALGRQHNWNADAACLGTELFARKRDNRGNRLAASGAEIAERVLWGIARASAGVILQTALNADELDGPAIVSSPLIHQAMDGQQGIVRVSVALDRPVIGLGASADLHYATIPSLIGNRCVVPTDADVANAIGAVVGQVSVRVPAYIFQPAEGLFRMSAGDMIKDYKAQEEAVEAAETTIRDIASRRATIAGTDTAEITVTRAIETVDVDGRITFVHAELVATATGRPRIAKQ